MRIDWRIINSVTLTSIDLDALLQNAQRFDCSTFQTEISRLEREEACWTPEQRECLRFVSAILTMVLRADNATEPFGPMFVIDGQRSAIPTDFPKEKLKELEPWAMSLSDPELRARFLDVLWIQTKSFLAAKAAVEAYIASALRLEDPKEWPSCHKRLERAVRLAASLGRGSADLKVQVLTEIEAMLQRHRGKDPLYLTLRLIRLLLEFKYGSDSQFAEFANVAAVAAEGSQDFWRAKDYYQAEADCHRAGENKDSETEALRCSAECLVKEAELARSQAGRGAIAAAAILSDAVEAMRQLPGGKDRAAELHEMLLNLQRESTTELKSISKSFDASELVHAALAAVRDRPISDAIYTLSTIVSPPSIAKLKQEVKDQARVAIFGSLITSEVLNSRGRVVARAPALEAGVDDLKHDGLRWRMYRHARLGRSLSVQATINPARLEILASHAPDRLDLASLIQHSPWIPDGHAESVLRALVAGFQGDMLVAAHLVPPQLEALVRHVVETLGGNTSMLEPGGVQPERSLGAMLETAEASQAFGEDGIFELQDLLVDPLGANLRNEVAHGLIDDSGLFGTDVLYAWWLLLRYCVLTSKMIERSHSVSHSPSTPDDASVTHDTKSSSALG
ncbi:DUF4209 domain-containing protein [Fluviibacter phosphoraccumulans]|uniref:DUF4209 domain-containing protein n=1 Tax=Fluviibacter phosphoraccumulans TaxID=1751046 RepID=A0A679I9K2_9RHOO|nr:DUF4209 domain-containing protein [Fluviibacter phosphoraccumulans]BBU69327.1 DUF4209 domain-containing protein [Fluviibacter phosphoraccumulans]BCA65262.1 DUF4209 domain-containing protein [Fluviibacter phosphoraccumulans]